MTQFTHVYSAKSQATHPRAVARTMFANLVSCRYLAYRLALREIKSVYSRTAFGMLWDFVDPLIISLVFYLMMRARILNVGDLAIPYSAYVIFGSLLYQTFAEATNATASIFRQFGTLLEQTKTTPEALLVSVFFRTGYISTFRVIVMIAAAILTGAYSIPGIFMFVLTFPLLILAGMAIGVMLAPFNAIYSDVGRALGTVLMPLRYITPTLFVFPSTPVWEWVYALNPISPILDDLRNLATTGSVHHPGLIAIHTVVFLSIGLVGWFIYHVSVPVLAGRS